MILPINLTTGPVGVTPEVMAALSQPPVSHRSAAFGALYNNTTDLLCSLFQVRQTFLLTGSGTMANECMLQEIKHIPGTGLILANGEFGARLMAQARRNNISFVPYQVEWGKIFDPAEIAGLMNAHSIQWILFCHCETSTGVVNDLKRLTALCKSNNCFCFVDCMSTVGTTPLDLSCVSMATASSGKGLASIPGLAIVFSNINLSVKTLSPVYTDLAFYEGNNGIPFTLSSNLLRALYVSVLQKLTKDQFELSRVLAEKVYAILAEKKLIPFAGKDPRVFTIVPGECKEAIFFKSLKRKISLSSESGYLKQRGWRQLAVFGYLSERQVDDIDRFLREAVRNSHAQSHFSLAS